VCEHEFVSTAGRAQDLPPKKETLLYVGLSDVQKKLYKEIFSKDMEALSGS
jgi:hypothetical protein